MSLNLSEADMLNVLVAIWEDPRYRVARDHAHREGHPAACDYITIAGQALQRENVARGGEWDDIGCNWRRARVGDQSMDGLSVKNPADGRYYFEDVIASAGAPHASIKYRHPFDEGALLREVAGGPYAPHGYADPRGLTTHFHYDVVEPARPAACTCDLTRVETALQALGRTCSALATQVGATKASVDAAKESADAAKFAAEHAQGAAEDARDEARRVLRSDGVKPPVYVSNRLPLVATITLRPQS